MHARRFTRLTNAHSKTVKHPAAMTAIFVCWYNFCRHRETVKATPAVACRLVKARWTIKDLLRALVASE
jgi:hypothetical protein